MHRVPPARAWWLAVGPRLERGLGRTGRVLTRMAIGGHEIIRMIGYLIDGADKPELTCGWKCHQSGRDASPAATEFQCRNDVSVL